MANAVKAPAKPKRSSHTKCAFKSKMRKVDMARDTDCSRCHLFDMFSLRVLADGRRIGFRTGRETPWIFVLLSAVITLLLGLLILAHWPVSSLYILGLFLGIDLIMAGVGWIGLGFGLRRGR
jgi:hypothetical protein